jgi:hypothetical protein
MFVLLLGADCAKQGFIPVPMDFLLIPRNNRPMLQQLAAARGFAGEGLGGGVEVGGGEFFPDVIDS